MKAIKLFNPNDKPFGRLSNNSYHPITINGKNYPTITNYILSNMLITPAWKKILQNTEIGGAKGGNNELIKAIDFFINPIKEQSLKSSYDNVESRVNKVILLSKQTGLPEKEFSDWANSQISISIAHIKKVYKNPDGNNYIKKAVKKYKSEKDKNKAIKIFIDYLKEKIPESPPLTKEEIERQVHEVWISYVKAGGKKFEDLDDSNRKLSEKEKYTNYITSQVRRPFDQINLHQLKNEIEKDNAINKMGIYQVYERAANDELLSTLRKAVDNAYNTLLKNTELQKILLGTGDFPIGYESLDPFLGVGQDRKGENLIGKILMQIRHNLRMKKFIDIENKKEIAKYKNIYDIYLAYTVLLIETRKNKKSLSEYLGLSPEQIINKFGAHNLVSGVPSQDTVIKLYKYDKLNPIVMREIFQPGTLVVSIRKNEIRNLRNSLEEAKDDIIFNSYLEYMITRNCTNAIDKEVQYLLDIQDKIRLNSEGESKQIKEVLEKSRKTRDQIMEEVIENTIASEKQKISVEELEDVKKRSIDLFNIGMLSASLSDKIDGLIKELNIPTEDEIRDAELAEIVPIEVKNVSVPMKDQSDEEDVASSDDGSPTTKYLKEIFKKDKENKKQLIEQIIKKEKNSKFSDFTDWDIKDLKQRLESLDKNEEYENYDMTFSPPEGNPIGIFEDPAKNFPELVSFSPVFFNGMLNIKGFNYPTIQHYIIASLISNSGTKNVIDSYGNNLTQRGIGVKNSHKLILIDPNLSGNTPQEYIDLQSASTLYENLKKDTDYKLLSLYSVTSLNKKFQDTSLQDLLLLTRSAIILWEGPDLFLGVGNNNNGNNYIGKTLMALREQIKENKKGEENVDVEESDIIRFINKDQFMLDWIKMRIKDMCDVVYKAQQYMKLKQDLRYDLTTKGDGTGFERLINSVLNDIYQPCLSTSKLESEDKIPVPGFVINIVKKCSGMSSGEAPIYTKGRSGNKQFNKEIEKYISKINKQINDLKSKFYGTTTIQHTKEEAKQFNDYQRDEWSNFMENIALSEDSQEAKLKEMEDFKKLQLDEYQQFWGMDKTEKTKEEKYRFEHEISELRRQILQYKISKKKENETEQNQVVIIAQMYWDRIVFMIKTLIKNSNPKTDSNIRDALVSIEMLTAEETNCVRIIKDEKDNCIVSALINLLKGIYLFNDELTPTITSILDEDDVKFAGSIILNSDFKPDNLWKGEQSDEDMGDIDSDPEFVGNLDDYSLGDIDKKYSKKGGYDIPDEGMLPKDFIDDDDEGGYDIPDEGMFPKDFIDDEDEDEEIGGYEENLKNPFFSFKWGVKRKKKPQSIKINSDIDKIQEQVELISSENSLKIAKEIIKMVDIIKKSKVPDIIKQNRINFFATIR